MAINSNKQFKIVSVIFGFHYGKHKENVQAAQVLLERKIHLVYGGGDRQLSRLILEAVFTF